MNKLLKKLTAFVLMLAFALPTVVMADDIPKLKLEVTEQAKAVNDNIKVKMSLSTDVAANADFEVKYDQNILELVDDGIKELSEKMDTTTADTSTAGTVKYTDIQNAGVTMTFKVKTEGETEITAKTLDMFLVERNDKATAEELGKMTSNVKTGVKKVEAAPNNNNANSNSNTVKKDEPNKQNTEQKQTETKSEEKKGFFGQFFEKVNNDWVLKILFIAILVIILILIILLIEYIIVSKRNKRKIQDDDYDVRVRNPRQSDERNSQPRTATDRASVNSQRNAAPNMQRQRRPLTEEERRLRAERLRRMSENGQAPRQRRPLTEEERKLLIERRKRREQAMNGTRQVRRPVDRDAER